jgi:hypothetical protein
MPVDPQQLADLQASLAETQQQHEANAAQGFSHELSGLSAELQMPEQQSQQDQQVEAIQARFEAKLYGRPAPAPAQAASPRQVAKPALGPDDELLFGATNRPSEAGSAGVNRVTPGKQGLPAEAIPNLQALIRIARSPGAPPQLAMLLSSLAQFSEQ